MGELLKKRIMVRENMSLLVGLSLCLYFSYHLMQGSRSFPRLMELNSLIATMSQSHDALKAETEDLQARVQAMRPGHLDRDRLEERARAVLGFRYPDEMTILGR